MRDNNALPPEPIIAALHAVQTKERLIKLIEYVASRTFTGRHEDIATAIVHAAHMVLIHDGPLFEKPLFDRALDNLGQQMEQVGA